MGGLKEGHNYEEARVKRKQMRREPKAEENRMGKKRTQLQRRPRDGNNELYS
jgi:hypothetical protein